MTTKKYLSNKKTSQQTISLSPALKEWIERYVKVNQRKNPDDRRFKSVSAFYNYVMEQTMESFKSGKTLDDFKRFIDEETKDFFDTFTFKGIIPFYEFILKSNRYTNFTFHEVPRFLLGFRKLFTGGLKPFDYRKLKERFERAKNFYLKNKLTKEIRLDIFTEENSKYAKGVFEYIGAYRNLFFENCKFNAALLAVLGVKITDITFSETDLYCRFDLIATDLLFRKEIAKRERFKLIEHNLSYLTNYYKIINDEDFYLWMKMSKDKGIFIGFKDNKVKNKWFNLIIKEVEKHSKDSNFLLNVLKYFERLHWIDIESEEELSFVFRLSKEKNNEDREFLLKFLSQHSTISNIDEKCYLE